MYKEEMLRHYIARCGTFKSVTQFLKVSGKPDCKKIFPNTLLLSFLSSFPKKRAGGSTCLSDSHGSVFVAACPEDQRQHTSGEMYNPCQDSAPGRKVLKQESLFPSLCFQNGNSVTIVLTH